MIPEAPNPNEDKLEVFVDMCTPATRGRWEFGHWKGTYEWTEATAQNSDTLSTTYWVSKDSLASNNKNGVCRALLGNHSLGGPYDIYPGTWQGSKGVCSYMVDGSLKSLDPLQPGGNDLVVEVLSGLDIGLANSTGSWKNSAGGMPFDSTGQNLVPPNPGFAPFLVGGDTSHPAFYLCRVKNASLKTWQYGYQVGSSKCSTDAGPNVTGTSEVLVLKTVKNADTGD